MIGKISGSPVMSSRQRSCATARDVNARAGLYQPSVSTPHPTAIRRSPVGAIHATRISVQRVTMPTTATPVVIIVAVGIPIRRVFVRMHVTGRTTVNVMMVNRGVPSISANAEATAPIAGHPGNRAAAGRANISVQATAIRIRVTTGSTPDTIARTSNLRTTATAEAANVRTAPR